MLSEFLHTRTALAAMVITGVGFTVIVKVCGIPLQETPFNVFTGVTEIVALIAVVPVLVAVNAAMLPVPLAARPMAVLLLVQV